MSSGAIYFSASLDPRNQGMEKSLAEGRRLVSHQHTHPFPRAFLPFAENYRWCAGFSGILKVAQTIVLRLVVLCETVRDTDY